MAAATQSIYSPVLEATSTHSVADQEDSEHAHERSENKRAIVDSEGQKYFNKSLILRIGLGFSIFIVGVILLATMVRSSSKVNGEGGAIQSPGPKRVYLSAEQEADAVEYLPGWSPLPMPSQQFSGFVDANAEGTLQMHYQFVECETNPSEAPLLLWFSGGPGASSLYGFYVELGPFLLSDTSVENSEFERTGIPQLQYNEFGWQKAANVLALSMPPPIGYSYCLPTGPSASGNDCGAWNDTSTALVTYHALTSWLKRFPQYAQSKVWISGESYAGVYVPEIVKNILANQPSNNIDLAGFLVGDACTPPAICGSDKVGPIWNIEFLYGKGAFSNKLYVEIRATCSDDELAKGVTTQACTDAVNKIGPEAGGYWAYAFYDDCWYENDIRRQRQRRALSLAGGTSYHRGTPGYYEYFGPPLHSGTSSRQQRRQAAASSSGKRSVGQVVENAMGFPADRVVDYPNGYQCGGPAAQVEWLGLDVVKKALNVPQEAVFFQSDNGVGFTYHYGENDLVSWYKQIIAENKLRIVVYNGDTDPCINSLQAQDWTAKLGFREKQSWRPWTVDGCQRMGGYVTRCKCSTISFLHSLSPHCISPPLQTKTVSTT